MITKQKFLLVGCLLLFSSFAQAKALIGTSVGLSIGYGTMKSQDLSLRDRLMQTITVQSLTGINIGERFIVGVYGELRTLDQRADPKGKLDEDLKGNGFLVAPGLHYEFSDKFVGHLIPVLFLGVHTRTTLSAQAQDITYKRPLGARLMLGYRIWKQLSLDFSFHYLKFTRANIDSQIVNISSNDVVYWNFGIGTSYRF